MSQLDTIIYFQKEFQRLLGIPVDSLAESDILQMAELHCFKAIEEIIELRKTFPSTLNKHEKNKAAINRDNILAELCDSLMYHINFASVWGFTPDEVISKLGAVQLNNFIKAKEKIIAKLNSEILMVHGEPAGVGSGSLMPNYIFVGQNPAEGITPGYKFFSNPEDGSSKILLPVLTELGIIDQCYFTNIVKSATPKNSKPTESLTSFWMEFYKREIEIVSRGCYPKIIPMGKWAQIILNKKGIPHPASVQYGATELEDFKKAIENYL